MKAFFCLVLLFLVSSAYAQADSNSTTPFTVSMDFRGDTVNKRLTVILNCTEPILGLRVRDDKGKQISEIIPPHAEPVCSLSLPISLFTVGRVYYVEAVSASGYLARKFDFVKG